MKNKENINQYSETEQQASEEQMGHQKKFKDNPKFLGKQ